MLGDRDAPVPVGAAKPNPRRDAATGEIMDRLQPVLEALLSDYEQEAVLQALGSWLATLTVRGCGADQAARLFRDMAAACPTLAAIDEARALGGGGRA